MILDNGSIHKSGRVRKYLKRWPHIHLFYLPPYSPEYNPVELIWKWLKPRIYGFMHIKNIDDIVKQFRKLIWHFNAGWLVNPIHLNLEAYARLL